MLKPRQSLPHSGAGGIFLPEVCTLENGCCEVVLVDQSKSNLPDVSMTDLKKCLDAGIDLKQVNPKVLGRQGVVTIVTGEPKQDTNDKGEN